MGFINLCKARGVTLDPELQQGITKDYKPGDIEYSIASNTQNDDSNTPENPDSTPSPPPPPEEDDTEERTKKSDDDEDQDQDQDQDQDNTGQDEEQDDDSNLRSDSSDSSGPDKRRPRGTGSLPEVPDRGDSVNPPIQIITDNRKKDKYIWIKIKADPNCLTGVIDNTYDSSEDTLKKLINLDDDSATTISPSAPPVSPDRGDSDGAGTGTTPSAPPLDETEDELRRKLGPPPPAPTSSDTTSQVSKPSEGFASNEPASNLVNPEETKPEPKTGGCDNVPEETELRSAPPPGKAKKDELFCPSQAPYLCGKKTITYQERLKNGLGAACRVKEHDCNSRKMPVGDSDTAKRVYQAADPETGLTARFYVDPQKDPGNITSCSKKTKGGSKKGGKKRKSLKNKRKKRKSLKN